MIYEAFYGAAYETIKSAERQLTEIIARYPSPGAEDMKSIVYACSRLKSPESAMLKLAKHKCPQTANAALTMLYDVVGARVVCAFDDDVYRVAEWLSAQPSLEICKVKDYIKHPKPNGYRSYHLLAKVREGAGKGCLCEIQVRTIAIDFWATLEHQIQYKKNLAHEALIRSELKRCADEIASVDLSMQTIRDIIKAANEASF